MAKQRKVNKYLGKNIAKDHSKMYKFIEEELGITNKRCSRSIDEPHPKYNFVHEGPNPLPIRNFNFQKSSKDLLQPNCRECEKKYRRGRLNASRSKFHGLDDNQIRDLYINTYGDTKRCGRCERIQLPSDFPISRGMETGLHNMCFSCQSNYSESLGDRWVIYSPDGRTIHKNNAGKCCINCSSTKNLHWDHKWPVSIGGTDFKENFQILCRTCNISKKASVSEFNSMDEIDEKMICQRYHPLLWNAQYKGFTIRKFEIEIRRAVQQFLEEKASMNDQSLKDFFQKENRRNNRKFNVKRSVKKFRAFYSNRSR